MTQLLDLMTGAQDAVVQLLRAQLPADQRGMVRHSLKQGAQPPFHLIGDIASADAGGKDEQAEDIEVDVHTVYRGADRRELLAMLHQVRVAVTDRRLVIDGALFRTTWAGASAGSASTTDGVTYAGVTTITLTAEPA
ncbi:tail completion protein gp17 [Sphingomonas adhaesiva]|uniref:tail completion protein gp17 n=1 Tax=Sphingomonas adhaesiva TaxID=28212 RepID=UPI002FF46FDD